MARDLLCVLHGGRIYIACGTVDYGGEGNSISAGKDLSKDKFSLYLTKDAIAPTLSWDEFCEGLQLVQEVKNVSGGCQGCGRGL